MLPFSFGVPYFFFLPFASPLRVNFYSSSSSLKFMFSVEISTHPILSNFRSFWPLKLAYVLFGSRHLSIRVFIVLVISIKLLINCENVSVQCETFAHLWHVAGVLYFFFRWCCKGSLILPQNFARFFVSTHSFVRQCCVNRHTHTRTHLRFPHLDFYLSSFALPHYSYS